ncbi:MAG: peptidoglycan editing factor PgeF [Candidatus Riflebacteria bacterium]|nr:peptidoglycan editing factor PgeF [Candidatus Riflebacteria bacterium]
MKSFIKDNILIAFSEASDEDLSFFAFSEEEALKAWNRLEITKKYNLSLPKFTFQEHGKSVLKITDPSIDVSAIRADALSTDLPMTTVGVFTADCIPLILTSNQAAAAAHSGWRGLKLNIAGATIKSMKKDFAAEPRQLKAYIGPCIQQCCYEVGKELLDSFIEADPSYSNFFKASKSADNKYYLDTQGIAKKQLLESGIPLENITILDKCTCCSKDPETGNYNYFSYRREKERRKSMFSFAVKLK